MLSKCKKKLGTIIGARKRIFVPVKSTVCYYLFMSSQGGRQGATLEEQQVLHTSELRRNVGQNPWHASDIYHH